MIAPVVGSSAAEAASSAAVGSSVVVSAASQAYRKNSGLEMACPVAD